MPILRAEYDALETPDPENFTKQNLEHYVSATTASTATYCVC
jgi:hypothetical protein